MSLKASGLVWRQSRQSGGALVVLLALADFADDTMRAWPAVATLALRARISRRAVHKLLAKLIQDGEIVQDGRSRRGVVIYQIALKDDAGAEGRPMNHSSQVAAQPMNLGSHAREFTREAADTSPVNASSGADVNSGSPNPLLNHQEPSQRPQAREGEDGNTMSATADPSWERVKGRFPQHQRTAWLDNLTFAGIDDTTTAHLLAPTPFVAARVRDQMGDDIRRAFAAIGFPIQGVNVTIGTVVTVKMARQEEGGESPKNPQRLSA